ncbi:XkdX family protein [Clostridium sp.]
MNWMDTITYFYNQNLYTVDQVKIFVAKSKITAEQYKTITGQDYTA